MVFWTEKEGPSVAVIQSLPTYVPSHDTCPSRLLITGFLEVQCLRSILKLLHAEVNSEIVIIY